MRLVGRMGSSTFKARRMKSMQKQWVTAVVMGVLALVTVPAWAQTCKNQMVLTPGAGSTATGTAEKKIVSATLKNPAQNKFEVDIHGKPLTPYMVMVSGGTTPDNLSTVGGIFTDSTGAGEFEVKNAVGTCSIHRVKVVALNGATVLSGNFDHALGVDDDAPEVEVEVENEVQAEVEAELNNIANNGNN